MAINVATVTRFASSGQSVHYNFYLYHKTETGFRIESETGLYKLITP